MQINGRHQGASAEGVNLYFIIEYFYFSINSNKCIYLDLLNLLSTLGWSDIFVVRWNDALKGKLCYIGLDRALVGPLYYSW